MADLNTIDVLQHKGFQYVNRRILSGNQEESRSHFFLRCPFPNFLWDEVRKELKIQSQPHEVGGLWSQWRKQCLSQSVRIEWDNSRIFLQKCETNRNVLASPNSFAAFWLENLPQQKRRTFERSQGPKGVAGHKALQAKAIHNRGDSADDSAAASNDQHTASDIAGAVQGES